MNARPPAGVRAAFLSRRLGTAAILCAIASIVAAVFVGIYGIVLFWAVATLLGVAGLIASIVGFLGFSEARWDVTVGLTTSLIALVGPILFFAWLVRSTEWGW
jgi:hypothetical protein